MSDQGNGLRFGDPVMNIAASDDNPIKYGMFTGRTGRNANYMTSDGRIHCTPADNITKAGVNPADEIASLRAQLASAEAAIRAQSGMEYFGRRFDRALSRAELAERRLASARDEADHWKALVGRADRAQFPFTDENGK